MIPAIPPRRVLIADDDPEVCRGVADLLDCLGLETFLAESGAQALEIVRLRPTTEPLHLLVLDVQMPGLTGLEVFASVRQTIDVPCIFCSGTGTAEIERQALRAGAVAFLHKPVQPQILRQHVLDALGGLGNAGYSLS